ncbi:MAG: thymidine phosphorylase [Ardenticatenia bacterium]|nr:thymidine phosphorylase [Ardenticatenia bacterium]
MRAVDIIAKKRDGGQLSEEEIRHFVEGYVRGDIPDYQAAAWCMAIFFQGMTSEETAALTEAMAHSGEMLDLHHIAPRVVDKHSSGGVGDKTTLVVAPLVASTGLPVAKMSGRGLGFSGGTLDKLESIPGFRVELSRDEFMTQVARIGLVVAAQTAELVPADRHLYALRDATATVESLPLIASSIMAKKLAGGADAIVLDVKVGQGAFMRTVGEARALAELMVGIGRHHGRDVTALLSDMNQPLGHAVGNALEVAEAVATLQGHGPADFTDHCLTVAAHMLLLGQKAPSLDAARELAREQLRSGAAWDRFKAMVAHQGGDIEAVEAPQEALPRARLTEPLAAPRAGHVAHMAAREVGLATVILGGGREKKGDAIDHAVGVVVHKKVGDRVEAGEPLMTIHANDAERLAAARERLKKAYRLVEEPVAPLPLFHGVISTSSGSTPGP